MQHSWYNSTLFYQQVKEIAKIRDFDYFDSARFARSQQAGNPLLSI